MRKNLIVFVIATVLTGSGCSSNKPNSTAPAPTTSTAPQTTQQSETGQGSSGSCPATKDFHQAPQEGVSTGLVAPIQDVNLDSNVVCKDYIAAAWVKIRQNQAEDRVIVVLRCAGDTGGLRSLGWHATKQTNDGGVFNYSPEFQASNTVCKHSPILDWLQSQGSCVS